MAGGFCSAFSDSFSGVTFVEFHSLNFWESLRMGFAGCWASSFFGSSGLLFDSPAVTWTNVEGRKLTFVTGMVTNAIIFCRLLRLHSVKDQASCFNSVPRPPCLTRDPSLTLDFYLWSSVVGSRRPSCQLKKSFKVWDQERVAGRNEREHMPRKWGVIYK